MANSESLTNQQTDEELLQGVAAGSQDALERVIHRWTGPLYSLAFKIVRDRSGAEEVVQDVFWKVWNLSGRYDSRRGRFSSWIFSIAHHQAIDYLRGKRARGADLASPATDLVQAVGASPLPGVTPWQKLRMARSIEALNPDQRKVVELSYFHGYTHEEMSRRLGEPLGTVKTRLRIALSKLRKSFLDPEPEFKSGAMKIS
jgi:RNA polymerase sigma-70 factor (ECF subfamily)